jgi:hypothetical protein
MPSKRIPIRRDQRQRITPEVVAAWKAADHHALQRALHLKVWEASPLPVEITPLGVCEEWAENPGGARGWAESYPQAIAFQRELLAVAGWPDCRAAYEENLRRAEETARYYEALVANPALGGQCTGDSAQSRRERLELALAEVEYRRALLAGLDD